MSIAPKKEVTIKNPEKVKISRKEFYEKRIEFEVALMITGRSKSMSVNLNLIDSLIEQCGFEIED